MSASGTLTLSKEERLCSKKLIEQLFNGGTARSMSSFPLRVVYVLVPRKEGQPQASILISVPKRHFKHAVDRNRVKRQLRESFRRQKHVVLDALHEKPGQTVALAFIWMEGQLRKSADVEQRIKNLLMHVAEQL